MNKRPNPDDYPAGSIYGYTVDLSKYCDELEEGTAGRDKTILAWLAKSKRQEKKIKKLDAEVELQLDRWVKVGKECIGLKDELKPLRLIKKNADDIIAGYENATIDSEHELATLKQSIDDAPMEFANWLNNNWLIPIDDGFWRLEIENEDYQGPFTYDVNVFTVEKLYEMFKVALLELKDGE